MGNSQSKPETSNIPAASASEPVVATGDNKKPTGADVDKLVDKSAVNNQAVVNPTLTNEPKAVTKVPKVRPRWNFSPRVERKVLDGPVKPVAGRKKEYPRTKAAVNHRMPKNVMTKIRPYQAPTTKEVLQSTKKVCVKQKMAPLKRPFRPSGKSSTHIDRTLDGQMKPVASKKNGAKGVLTDEMSKNVKDKIRPASSPIPDADNPAKKAKTNSPPDSPSKK